MAVYELVYCSVARTAVSKEEFEGIGADAQTANSRNGITGVLIYFRETREFAQVLEGSESVVKALMEKISEDPRHTSIDVLHEGDLTKRAFPDWDMHLSIKEAGGVLRQLPDLKNVGSSSSLHFLRGIFATV